MEDTKYLPELLAEKDSLDSSFTHAMKLIAAGKGGRLQLFERTDEFWCFNLKAWLQFARCGLNNGALKHVVDEDVGQTIV